ncbi:probable leucine-rich repeat receptor-like protein kinase At1g35710 [Cornus florida]|uniref:probable leucine-rich repeat receptor-like protein kinase At1g35710 n=1 Tax=Cornus florida TaxID=4283 RepID=UPI002897424A|nr:probable leucine-rich repeat receptor-like protein kinase At1g35710 [Cornus florida]
MDFDPTSRQVMLAIYSMTVMSKSLWEQKLGIYSSFGLPEDDIIAAFKLQPVCMLGSEEKIRKLMGFFVNQLKLKPKVISKHPNLLLLSLEKRIVPRCAVLQLLMSKNMIKGDLSLIFALKMTEKMFVGKFVRKFENEIPEVVEARQGALVALPQFVGVTCIYPVETKLTGTIPEAIGNISGLLNSLTGEIFLSLAKLGALQELLLSDDDITGKIPEFIGSFSRISFMVAYQMSWLTVALDLSRNSLNGSVPTSLLERNLSELLLISNELSGGIPPEFGNYTKSDSFTVGIKLVYWPNSIRNWALA